MIDVTIEQAYREACALLGESIVRERLLSAEFERLTAQAGDDTDSDATPPSHP